MVTNGRDDIAEDTTVTGGVVVIVVEVETSDILNYKEVQDEA